MNDKAFNRNFALVLLLVLTIFLLVALRPFYTAILTSIILFALFNPIYKLLLTRVLKNKKTTCALITLLIILLIVIVPLFTIGNLIVAEITELSQNSFVIDAFSEIQQQITPEKVELFAKDISGRVFTYLKDSFGAIIESVANFFLSLVIIFFLLYFMFVHSDEILVTVKHFIPFNAKNTNALIAEFDSITHSTVIGSGLLAVLQGILLSVGFIIFGIRGAALWGIIAAILAFLPVVGASLVYIPAGLIMLLQADYFAGIGILAWGFLLITNVDTFLRPVIGKRIANIHPLITLVGVFIGLRYFGMIGIIIGPLLLSYFFLLIKMFKEEHIGKKR